MKTITAFVLFAMTLSVARTAEMRLPDPLVFANGNAVKSAEDWSRRRGELIELFRENIYGRAPVGRPDGLKFEVCDMAADAMDGKATRKQVKISFHGLNGEGAIKLILFTPNNAAKPAPCFLLICNRSITNIDATRENKSEFWPAEDMIARGYAAAAFYNGDVAADKANSFSTGVHAIFLPVENRKPDSWGTIAAWAWGASRCLDYLATDPAVDAKRVAVVGHSRGGKTALWAAAEDERFAMAVSNESGSTGAAIARNKQGEQIANINKGFPFWFNDNYKKFNGRENDLPVDQHELLALIAPRLLYVASAIDDKWSDPNNEFLATVYASPVYELLRRKGIGAKEFPKLDSPIQTGDIAYHARTGKHNLTAYDWKCFLDFTDRHGWRSTVTAR
jgi:hypothetical protein